MIAEIAILTKSTMRGAYCIAGLNINTGKWMRLVRDAEGNPLTPMYGNCEPHDVVKVEVESVPLRNQTENCRVIFGTMQKAGTWNIDDVVRLHPPERHEYVFGNNSPSLSADEMQRYNFNYSLMLIKADRMNINGGRAAFTYNGRDYHNMRVTDPYYEGINAGLGNAYIVVSMPSSPYRGAAYGKFAAKVFP